MLIAGGGATSATPGIVPNKASGSTGGADDVARKVTDDAAHDGAEEAARRAAEEAARRAAEEAARKAAEEATRKAAEEATRKAFEEAARSRMELAGRPDSESAAPPPEPETGVPTRFGRGTGGLTAPDPAQAPDRPSGGLFGAIKEFAAEAAEAARAATAELRPPPTAQQIEVQKAQEQATRESAGMADEGRAKAEAEQKALNAEVPLAPGDERVTRGFNEQELQAYRELAAADRQKFNETYDYLHCLDESGQETPASEGARDGFRTALVEGKLTATDGDGTSVLDHFQRRAGTGLAPQLPDSGIDAKGQLQTLAYQLGNPGSIYQGADTDDCVAASLQTRMAAHDPAEYMRIATGLIFDGEVVIHGPDGDATMKLDKSALHGEAGEQYSVRATTNQLVQQSFMTYARETFPPKEGDGLFMGGRGGGRGGYGGGEGGLTLPQAEGLFEHVAGRYATAVGIDDGNEGQAGQALERAVEAGSKVQVGLQSDRGGHMVSVLAIETDENGQKSVRFSDSQDGEEKSWPLDDFMAAASGMILPSEFAEMFARPILVTGTDRRNSTGGRISGNRGVGS